MVLWLMLGAASQGPLAGAADWHAASPLASVYVPAPLLGSRPAALSEDDCELPAAAGAGAGLAAAGTAGGAGLARLLAPTTAVAVAVAVPAPPPPSWQLRTSDRTLNGALSRWASGAGWQLVWELPADYAVDSDTSINGTFEQAVDQVVASMATAEVPMKAIFYQGNHVLRLVAKGAP